MNRKLLNYFKMTLVLHFQSIILFELPVYCHCMLNSGNGLVPTQHHYR
ncbi:cysteine protease ATG4 [Candida albicans P37037]|nr:cysteine protease ATG4 [Candida albicans P37037]